MGKDVEKNGVAHADAAYPPDLMDIVGGNGRWQNTIFAILFLAAMPSAWHNLAMTFFAPTVDHWCAQPVEYENFTVEQWKAYAIPKEGNGYSQCFRYRDINMTDIDIDIVNETINFNVTTEDNRTDVVRCTRWNYDNTEYVNTVVSQWDLVCEKDWMISMTKSVFMAGFFTAVLVLGQLSDRIGRKPVIVLSTIILLLSGIICAFSASFVMFTVTRFFVALGSAGIFNTGFVLLMEIVSANSRSAYGIAIEFGWATGYILLTGMAWIVRDWFWLQLLLTVPCAWMLLTWWIIPESPRWLLTQGQLDKARKVLIKIARKNKKEVQDIDTALKKFSFGVSKDGLEKSHWRNVIDLICTPGMWQRTLNIFFCWFVISFIYYGLTFNTNDLAGDHYVNFALSAVVEFPAYFISIFVIKSLGRKLPLMITMVAGGLACVFTVPLTGALEWYKTPLAMFGKFCITASFAIVYVYTAELFPTVVRNTGIGLSSTCARVGSILAPFVKELGNATHPAVPLAVYGALSIISGLLILLLPETNRCKVPDTVQEAVEFGRKRKNAEPEMPEPPKPCAIHDVVNEKLVKPPSPILKPASDGKKLPDLLEEPSIIDETMENMAEDIPLDQFPIGDASYAPESEEIVGKKPEMVDEDQEPLIELATEENIEFQIVSEDDNPVASSQQTPL